MELSALTRWESIGKDLYARGKLGSEIERIKQFSKMLSAARKKQKQSSRTQQQHSQQHQVDTSIASKLSGIAEIKEDESEEALADDEQLNDVSPLPLLDAIEAAEAAVTDGQQQQQQREQQEERMQDAIESKELDKDVESIPPTHLRVSAGCATLHCTALARHTVRQTVRSSHWLLWLLLSPVVCFAVQLLFFTYRALRRFGKGFLVGYVGKLLFGVLSALLRSRGRLTAFWKYCRPLFRRSDVVGYGLFLGGFLAAFESLMRLMKQYKEKFQSRRLRVVLSAGLSGLCFFFIPPEYRVSLSMFFFVRALEISGTYGADHGFLPTVPQSDTLLMASASCVVVWCWLFHRSALEPAYAHFLDIQGGKPRWVTDAYTQCHFGNEALFASHPIIDIAQQQRTKLGLPLLSPASPTLRCDVLHPGQGHAAHMFTFLGQALLRALPVYVPVYVLPLLVFRMRDILRAPGRSLYLTAFSVARSSLFLASCGTACWSSACLLTNYLHSPTSFNALVAGWLGGATVLIEKKSRRIELALYVLAQAVPAAFRCLHDWGYVPRVRHADAAVFVGSIAVIMAAYVLRPHLLRRSYLSLLLFFFGSGGRSAGFHTKKQLDSPLLSSNNLSELERKVAKQHTLTAPSSFVADPSNNFLQVSSTATQHKPGSKANTG